jgi:hypothetical protein
MLISHRKVKGIGNIKYKGQPRVKSKIAGPGSLESVEYLYNNILSHEIKIF